MLPFLLLAIALAQALPQNPSPMSDTTRPHPRVAPYDVPGRRAPLTLGTVYTAPSFDPAAQHLLLVHLHGAPWLLEHHVLEHAPQAVLVTVQLGGGSRVYADSFSDPDRLRALVREARERVSVLAGRPIEFYAIALTSFSAGYGGIRSILRHREHYELVEALILADSLHAGYVGDATAPRTADLPVDLADLDVFHRFAADAAAGRKWMRVTHSEVYPGTYASTTETADVLLAQLGARRVPVLREGPLGMQQLSEARRGNFHLAGFAGNSAPDHMDHLYALGEVIATLDLSRRKQSSVPRF